MEDQQATGTPEARVNGRKLEKKNESNHRMSKKPKIVEEFYADYRKAEPSLVELNLRCGRTLSTHRC